MENSVSNKASAIVSLKRRDAVCANKIDTIFFTDPEYMEVHVLFWQAAKQHTTVVHLLWRQSDSIYSLSTLRFAASVKTLAPGSEVLRNTFILTGLSFYIQDPSSKKYLV